MSALIIPVEPVAGSAPAVPGPSGSGPAVRRLWRVRGGAAASERAAFIGLLIATAIAYTINLSASGWANSFYSAAVQAGSVNWEAFFYGSSDAANSITVDKPPASLWVMALSVRIFGLSSWSILLPEVLMGVSTIAIVYVTVRRHFSAPTALLAGGVLAVTPVAALMFRFNNPDALLVLLLTFATYLTLRGVETAKVRWLLLAGVMIGVAFLTKQLQAFLILPVLAGVYLWAAPTTWGKRLLHLVGALGAIIVSAGWWVAIVQLVPANLRPFIGGSQNNDFLELTFGYNGLGRVTGNETGSVGGGGGAGSWGATGISRLFTGEFGGQIAWLLPAALVLLAVGFVLLRRAARVDPRRATLALFGGSLSVTALVFSFMAGIFHAYYTVALAPAIAGVIAVGGSLLWSRRSAPWARIVAAAVVLITAVWAYSLLALGVSYLPWLKFVSVALGVVAAVLLLSPTTGRAMQRVTLTVTILTALLAPTAYTIDTIFTAHAGSIVTAGPAVAGAMGARGGPRTGFGGLGRLHSGNIGVPPALGGGAAAGRGAGATPTGGATGAAGGTARGLGGLLGGGSVSAAVVSLLEQNAADFRWAAAVTGSNNASGYQLDSGEAVMPVGGFNGSDPSPTLEQFRSLVVAGDIHYYLVASVGGRSSGGSTVSGEIAAWVAANYQATVVDDVTLYDLSSSRRQLPAQ